MVNLILFWALTIASIVGMIKWKKPLLLTVPIGAIGVYVAFKVVMVPLPLWETIQMILGWR